MPRNNKKLPKFPEDYLGKKANKYDNLNWMERNQKKTTLQCINYLFDEKLGNFDLKDYSEYLILDLGCGTGFSTEILAELGFDVIGIDILSDMISIAEKKKYSLNNEILFDLVLSSISLLPLRPNKIDHIISVSAYNFITYDKNNANEIKYVLNKTAKYLNEILKDNGRIAMEFYPNDEKELNFIISSFKNNHFDGYYVKDNPNQKGGKTFLLLKKV